jgi:hypothetical protein
MAAKIDGTPTQNGILKSISLGVKGNDSIRSFRLALYTDLNGKPGALVPGAITIEGTTKASSFEIIELPIEQGEPKIEAGKQYWMVVETTGTYLFYSDKWLSAPQICSKSNVPSYSWPDLNGTVTQCYNAAMGAYFFTYDY